MDTKDIDELLEALLEENVLKAAQIADIEVTEIDANVDEVYKIFENIMNKIGQKNYDYFFSKIYNDKYRDIVIELLHFSPNEPKNIEAIIEIIENKTRREELGLDSNNISRLITSTKNPEYIKGIIENKEKREEFGLDRFDLCSLIEATGNPEYIKGIIENVETRTNLGLDRFDLCSLIEATGDPEYIKGIIENKEKREEFGLERYDIIKLIASTNDSEYIKGIIENKEKREKLGFNIIDNIIYLIQATVGTQYIKELIGNKEKRKNLGLDSSDLRRLIEATGDPKELIQYIKELIGNEEKRKNLGLQGNDLIEVLTETRDVEYIIKMLENEEIREELGLNSNILLDKSNQSIILPSAMTIGIEIESEGLYGPTFKQNYTNGWKGIGDGSLKGGEGIEIVSPILTGNQEQSSESIKQVCRMLNLSRSNSV